ncbi:hypothetical protein [Spirilliplanes yamanashiensis]|uniref:Lipoprotein n=1 Tax=Spirilliplanes yamanashiensis TaxID=42233 RepID=A0A8J3YD78_9ACTN|nr:hypothetical protein [Spirilliplanes yamanashiensis]MDP9816089.1 hypothetical protein [Spirilliplanes yamanashiensis]GIJ05612.1 hypothetical protein Sya03_49640 [Spirilliplanes yamanashiensis]
MRIRRVLATAPVVALLTTAVACSGDDGPPLPDRTGPTVAATLTATLTRTPDALTWSWSLRNDEPAEIAVFSGDSADEDGAGGGSSNSPTAWVVPRDDTTVEVSKRLLAQPPDVGLARPSTQYGTVLPAGTTLAGTATVSLPLRLAHPYRTSFDPPLRLPEDPESVVFCIGVARAEGFPPRPFETPAGDGPTPAASAGTLYASPDGAAPPGARKARYVHGSGERQHLVCAPPQPL